VAEILAQTDYFYGSEVRLEGTITEQVSPDPEYDFTDGTGTITLDFGMGVVARMNTRIRVTGQVRRDYNGLEIGVSSWRYLPGL
jgi:uncharacterized protein YdeI (BOF family)